MGQCKARSPGVSAQWHDLHETKPSNHAFFSGILEELFVELDRQSWSSVGLFVRAAAVYPLCFHSPVLDL
jgi:hypothetical protein